MIVSNGHRVQAWFHTCAPSCAQLRQAGPGGGSAVLPQTAPQGRIKNAGPSSVLQITDLEGFQHGEAAQWTCGILNV